MTVTNINDYNWNNRMDQIEVRLGKYANIAKPIPDNYDLSKYPHWKKDSMGALQAKVNYETMRLAIVGYGKDQFACLSLSNHFLPNQMLNCEKDTPGSIPRSGGRYFRYPTKEDRESCLFARATLLYLSDDIDELLAFADQELTQSRTSISECEAEDREDALSAARDRGDFDI